MYGLSTSDLYFNALKDNFEDRFSRLCRRYIRDDYICLDIGANIGVTSLLIGDVCPKGAVIAVEPGASVFEALQQNIAANDLANVTPDNCAVGDKIGTARFVEHSAWGHIDEAGVEVKITTLAELKKRHNLPRVDFVKIDVEGYEPHILRSAADFLVEQRSLVYVEYNSWCLVAHSRFNPIEFLELVFDKFSEVYLVKKRGEGLIERLEPSNIIGFAHDNMVSGGCVDNLLLTSDRSRLA